MADLPHTICFRASTLTWEALRRMAERENRKLGDLVRILIEQVLSSRRGNPNG